MKPNFLFAGGAALILSAAAGSALAVDSNHQFLGEPASSAAADRTVSIGPNTDWLEVKEGEAVKFVAGDKTFTWNFDRVAAISKFNMDKIAPPGILDHKVVIYMDGSPRDYPN